MAPKQALHQLIEELPERELHTAEAFLEFLRSRAVGRDARLRTLETAPVDDEPTTSEEDDIAREAWREYQRGEYISADQAKQRLLGQPFQE
jgi:hypothetical protein